MRFPWLLLFISMPESAISMFRLTGCGELLEEKAFKSHADMEQPGTSAESTPQESLVDMINHAVFQEIPEMLAMAESSLQNLQNEILLTETVAHHKMDYTAKKIRKIFVTLIDPRFGQLGRGYMSRIKKEARSHLQVLINNVKVLKQSVAEIQSIISRHLQISCKPLELALTGSTDGQGNFEFTDDREDDMVDPWTTRVDTNLPLTYLDPFLLHETTGCYEVNGLTPPFTEAVFLQKSHKSAWTSISPENANPASNDIYRIPYLYLNTDHRPVLTDKVRRQLAPEGTVHLTLLANHHLSGQLLWAFSRLTNMMTDTVIGTDILSDETCIDRSVFSQPPTELWTCLEDLAKTSPERALKNPTTFQLMVIALYVNRWEWSKGDNTEWATAKIH